MGDGGWRLWREGSKMLGWEGRRWMRGWFGHGFRIRSGLCQEGEGWEVVVGREGLLGGYGGGL
ncbi:unnamed protein product [Prunus armeniaca]|uniref:Uncharacterized protein n=1 Tax=Prunus armeniaca TaxID=36596 RepID=A0A6J5VTU0_PRUAR|nr:unnamed protein product [Prunus armeniaca]